MPELTSAVIKTANAPGLIWDDHPSDKVNGFGLRVHAGGAKSFFLNYRIDGREGRVTIGRWPTWSVKAARAEAKDLRRLIDRGRDPAQEKREHRQAPTVQDLIDRYIDEHLPAKTARGESRQSDEKRMLAEIGERLGKLRKVADVHFGDITAMHRAITESGRPVRANRILAIASKMFALALKPRAGETKLWRNAADGNPCRGVRRNHEEPRERFFSQAELAAISDALIEHGETTQGRSQRLAKTSSDCVRLIMLTGCRPSEALLADWPQFDNEPGYWVKLSAHTKQRKVHKLPLSPAAIKLIERLRKDRPDGIQCVFPGATKSGEPLKALWHVWHAVRDQATVALWGASSDAKIAAVVSDLQAAMDRLPSVAECRAEADRRGVSLPPGLTDARIYDLRHTFASIGAGGGLSLPIIGRLLGHTVDNPSHEGRGRLVNHSTGS